MARSFCRPIFFLCLIFALATLPVRSDPSALLEHLLSDYDKRIRPFSGREGDDRPVIIEMTIVLAILTELKWRDPGLTWEPRMFNSLRQLVVPQSLVWVPKMFVYNSLDTKEMLTENRYDLRVSYDGQVKVNIPQFVTCICRLEIELFPFDTQFCAIAQASPLLNTSEMDVNSTQPPRDSYFAGNAEWAVINVTVRHMKFLEDGEYRAEVHYIMHLNRRPIYYLTVIVAPTFLISALSLLGIFSPGSNEGPRSEKVSLGLGSLLAMTVLLDIVAQAMPKSNSIPLLGYYIIAVIFLNAAGVSINMALLSLSRHLIIKAKLPSSRAYSWVWLEPKSPKQRHREFSIQPRGPSMGSFCALSTAISPLLTETEAVKAAAAATGLTRDNSSRRGNGEVLHNGDRTGNKLSLPALANTTIIVTEDSEERQFAPDSAELLSIYNKLVEIAKTQKIFQRRIEKRKWKNLVEREWNRYFAQFDYLFLFIFELLNLLLLLMFLRFSWLPVPELPADFSL